MAGGMAMSGKSIDFKSRNDLKELNSTEVATKDANVNFLQMQRAKNDLLSKNILEKLYRDRFLRQTTPTSNITNVGSSKVSNLDGDEKLDLKNKAMEILAELYKEKEIDKNRKRRDTYQSASPCEKTMNQAR